MPNEEKFREADWDSLLESIKAGKCTPFLGAGACHGTLPLGGEIARHWADKYTYPLSDSGDLSRVAQYVAIMHDAMFPKDRLVNLLRRDPPDFTQPEEPHGLLASLPLSIYLTSNYDGYMSAALAKAGKDPKRDFCRWNSHTARMKPEIPRSYSPTVANPLVYHLHGHLDCVESMVLTEDDYLDFLVNVTRDRDMIPLRIKQAISGTSLMFVGYRLADWNFRVLFRGLVTSTESSLRRISVTVQLPEPSGVEARQAEAIRDYLKRYFQKIDMRVYWGTAKEFALDLRKRWEQFK